MINYTKSEKGYFFKIANGVKTRISIDEYNKKNKKGGSGYGNTNDNIEKAILNVNNVNVNNRQELGKLYNRILFKNYLNRTDREKIFLKKYGDFLNINKINTGSPNK